MGSSSLWGSRLGEQQQQKFAPQRDSNLTSQQVTKYSQGLQTVFLLSGLQRVLICFLSLKLQYVKNILERKSIEMPSKELVKVQN